MAEAEVYRFIDKFGTRFVSHTLLLWYDASDDGTHAILALSQRRVQSIRILGVHAASPGRARPLVDAMKARCAGCTLSVSSPPCLSRVAVKFWMLYGRFNPSNELRKLNRLYDGSEERVSGMEDVHLTWVSDESFQAEVAEEVCARFQLRAS